MVGEVLVVGEVTFPGDVLVLGKVVWPHHCGGGT